MTARVAVLASGGGSNFQALLDHLDALGDGAAAEVVLLASDRADAGALQRARQAGVPALTLDRTQRTDGLAALLAEHGIEVIALAGYLRLVPTDVTRRWHGRIVNVHPSLLPAFGGPGMYGRRVHEGVLAAGARVSGVTVHFVDAEYDRGPIIAQWPVPVFPTDTADGLARRVLCVEHRLYPAAVHGVATGRIRLDGDRRVIVAGGAPVDGHFSFRAGAAAPDVDSLYQP